MLKFFGVNHTLTKENFRRLQWLAENDPMSEGKTVNEILNEVIEGYFRGNGLERLIPRISDDEEEA